MGRQCLRALGHRFGTKNPRAVISPSFDVCKRISYVPQRYCASQEGSARDALTAVDFVIAKTTAEVGGVNHCMPYGLSFRRDADSRNFHLAKGEDFPVVIGVGPLPVRCAVPPPDAS